MHDTMPLHCVIICVLIVSCCNSIQSKRILLVSSQISSHFLEQAAISEGLVRNGHEVYATVSTTFTKGKSLLYPGVKILHFQTKPGIKSLDELASGIFESDNWSAMRHVSDGVSRHCEAAVHDKEFMKQIKDLKFDLAVVDGFTLNFCNLLIPYVHNISFIFCHSHIHPWLGGIPASPSFVSISAHHRDLLYNDRLTFLQRVQNLLWYILLMKMTPFPGRNNYALLHEFAPEVKSWEELAYKSALFVETRNHILEWPQVEMPNFIHLPGITARAAKSLPDNLKQIVSSSTHNVIIVSFGSREDIFPEDIINKLIKAFNQLEETIIWKFSGPSLDYVRSSVNSNIHVLPWLPQNDLLGHSKTNVFVTQCGNNGQYEAVYHAVPMVGLPIFADQHHNAFRMQDHGYGISLLPDDLLTFSVPDLVAAIREVSSNPKYKAAIQIASDIMKDSPMDPVETITYYMEHIMRYGSGHLRSHGMDMPWYQFFMIDILLIILVILILIVCLAILLFRLIIRVCRKRKSKKE